MKKHMITIAICEDHEKIRKEIRDRIWEIGKSKDYEIGLFANGEELLCSMDEKEYDIYYLDIELGKHGMNGYEVAKEVRRRQKSAILIFLSSHDEYACDAYEVGALRFLRKPIEEEKFAEAFKKVEQLLGGKNQVFSFKSDYKQKQIPLKNIIYFESSGRKIVLHLVQGKNESFYGSIRQLQKEMEHTSFCMCHTSFVVNIAYVRKLTSEQIYLDNGEHLPVSRGYKNKIKDAYMKYNFMLDQEAK